MSTGNGQTHKSNKVSADRELTAHHLRGDSGGVRLYALDAPDPQTQASYEYMFECDSASGTGVQYQLHLRRPGASSGVTAEAAVAALLEFFARHQRGTANNAHYSSIVPKLEFVLDRLLDYRKECNKQSNLGGQAAK